MKKLVFALCMVFGAVAVNAQDTTSTSSPTDPTSTTTQPSTAMQEDGRVKIKSQELPESVKSSLESQEYRGWLVNSAYKLDAASTSGTGAEENTSDTTSVSGNTEISGTTETGAHATEVYIVELKNGAQTKTVRFDQDGKKLDDGEMNEDQK
jgi:hypothetical protein